ncbi:MAG: hypothetical protein ACK5LT_06070 [Lachnospirales bacterium]
MIAIDGGNKLKGGLSIIAGVVAATAGGVPGCIAGASMIIYDISEWTE